MQASNDFATSPCVVRPPVPAPVMTRFGRLFNLPNDVVVTLAPKATASGTNCEDGDTDLKVFNFPTGIEPITTGLGFKPGFTRMAIDDFDLDGFDDVFIIGPFLDPSFNPILEVYQAFDVNDTSQGLTARNSLVPATGSATLPRSEPVTGDFNGDGIVDVAWVGDSDSGDLEIFIASICPNDQVTVLGETCGTLKPILSTQSSPTGLK